MSVDTLKLNAAEKAAELVEDDMLLGLGTGSTAAIFVDLLGQRVREGLKITGVPTSEDTRRQAENLSIPLTTLDQVPYLDMTVDGADELDGDLRLIKGGGGALLREKIVAMASDRMVVIADQSKLVETLGTFPLPIEVAPFGLDATRAMIKTHSEMVNCQGEISLRKRPDGENFLTDGGHYILDCSFGRIPDPEGLFEVLSFIPGIVETGLFLGIADLAFVAGEAGVTILEVSDDNT